MMNIISDFRLHCLFSRPGFADTYTQIVWADTYTVGCGFTGLTIFPENDIYARMYLCLYGPGGNIEGNNVYQIGPACSACPAGTTCDDGLCA
jgi:hypothetical protein